MASHPTAWRVVSSGWATEAVETARREARQAAWDSGMAPESVTLDFDATLVTSHSEKEDAAPNYKNGFGFHPLLVFLDETEEALAGVLRPGNAGSNAASDHVDLLAGLSVSSPQSGSRATIPATTQTWSSTRS